VALYQGKRAQAMLVGRQSKNARAFEEKQFVGFYTFNAGLIARLRQEFLELARGRCSAWREFLRLQAIDQASKQLDAEFRRARSKRWIRPCGACNSMASGTAPDISHRIWSRGWPPAQMEDPDA